MRAKLILLLTLIALGANAQENKLEIGLLNLSMENTEYSDGLPVADPIIELTYSYQIKPKIFFVASLGYESQWAKTKCPGSICYEFTWENYYSNLGIRRYFTKPSRAVQLFLEPSLQIGRYEHFEYYSGGIAGSFAETRKKGWQTAGVLKLGVEKILSNKFYLGLNSKLTVGNIRNTKYFKVTPNDRLDIVKNELYGNITFLNLRLGYNL